MHEPRDVLCRVDVDRGAWAFDADDIPLAQQDPRARIALEPRQGRPFRAIEGRGSADEIGLVPGRRDWYADVPRVAQA